MTASEATKIIFCLLCCLPCCFSVCRQSYATLCDTFRDLAQQPNPGSVKDAVIGTVDNFNKKEPVHLMEQLPLQKYYSLSTLTVINSINNLKKTYGAQCSYENYSLDYLNFFGNELGQIEPYHFPILTLKRLSLVNNKIEAIKANAFQFNRIREFDASENFLEVIESQSLPSTATTEIITLIKNRISHIELQSFGSNLKILRLDHNKLRYLQEYALDDLKNLVELSLSYNKFTEIPNVTRLKKLKIFDIAYNEIKTVSAQVFAQMEDLTLLDISGNKIQSSYILDSIILPNKQSSLTVSLAMNSLTYLNTSGLRLQKQTFILYGNPWDCKQWSKLITQIGTHISKCDTEFTSTGKAPYCFDFILHSYFLNDNFKRDVINYHNLVKNSLKDVNCALNPDKNQILLQSSFGCVG